MRGLLTLACALLALPVVAIFASWLAFDAHAYALLRHQAETVLAGCATQSLWLCLGVAAGVALLGMGTAVAVALSRFPGRAVFEWALLLPLAMPAYVMAYAYTDALQFSGPVQSALRHAFGGRRRCGRTCADCPERCCCSSSASTRMSTCSRVRRLASARSICSKPRVCSAPARCAAPPTWPCRWRGRRSLPARVLSLGYAIPGAVVAIGILLPVACLQSRWPDSGVSSLFTGTVTGVMFAYLVRFSAVAMQSVEAGYARIPMAVGETSRMLGGGPLRLFGRLHLPLLRRSALAAGLLVFVDTMKELPATLVLRPFGSDTLAVVAYNLARDERLAEAALPSLAIVAVGLAPVILLARTISRNGDASAGHL